MMSLAPAMTAAIPERRRGWSSTTSTRIVCATAILLVYSTSIAPFIAHAAGPRSLRRWLCLLPLAVKGLGNQRLGVFLVKRRQDYLLNPYIARSDCVECSCERVTLTDFVFPICADYEQVANSRMDKQELKEVQSRRIDPLQIVEEQCKRMLFTCKHVQ